MLSPVLCGGFSGYLDAIAVAQIVFELWKLWKYAGVNLSQWDLQVNKDLTLT